MKNKNLIFYAIGAFAIYHYYQMKSVKGIDNEALKLTKKEASKLKFKIDTRTMEDIYRQQNLKY